MYRQRRYNPRRSYYPQSSGTTTPYISQFQPAIPTEMLQQRMGNLDKRYRENKNMSKTLIDNMNKANIDSRDKNFLSDHYDKELQNLDKMVDEQYDGDWARASDDIADKIIELRKPMHIATQRKQELDPYRKMENKLKIEGNKVYGSEGLHQGTFSRGDDGELIINDKPDLNMRMANPEAISKGINREMSTYLNQQVDSLPPKDLEKLGLYAQSTIAGMSDDQVEAYIDSLPDERLQDMMGRIQNMDVFVENEFDGDMEKAREYITNTVKDQTVQRKRTKYSDNGNGRSGNSGNSYMPTDSSLYRTETSSEATFLSDIKNAKDSYKMVDDYLSNYEDVDINSLPVKEQSKYRRVKRIKDNIDAKYEEEFNKEYDKALERTGLDEKEIKSSVKAQSAIETSRNMNDLGNNYTVSNEEKIASAIAYKAGDTTSPQNSGIGRSDLTDDQKVIFDKLSNSNEWRNNYIKNEMNIEDINSIQNYGIKDKKTQKEIIDFTNRSGLFNDMIKEANLKNDGLNIVDEKGLFGGNKENKMRNKTAFLEDLDNGKYQVEIGFGGNRLPQLTFTNDDGEKTIMEFPENIKGDKVEEFAKKVGSSKLYASHMTAKFNGPPGTKINATDILGSNAKGTITKLEKDEDGNDVYEVHIPGHQVIEVTDGAKVGPIGAVDMLRIGNGLSSWNTTFSAEMAKKYGNKTNTDKKKNYQGAVTISAEQDAKKFKEYFSN